MPLPPDVIDDQAYKVLDYAGSDKRAFLRSKGIARRDVQKILARAVLLQRELTGAKR